MNHHYCSLFLLLLAVLGLTTGIYIHQSGETASNQVKNVILISLDATRADHLPCYGYSRNTTPYLCRFFEQGLKFENVLSQATMTTPSHTSLFTSQTPFDFQHIDVQNETHADQFRDSLVFLAEVLKSNGFETAGLHAGPMSTVHNIDQGFDLWKGRREISGFSKRINRSLAWMIEHKDEKKFLFLHTMIIHEPYMMENGDAFPITHPRLKDNRGGSGVVYFNQNALPAENLSIEETRGILKVLYQQVPPQELPFVEKEIVDYQGKRYSVNIADSLSPMISAYDYGLMRADSMLKNFFEALKAKGMLKNSLIIVTADHGEAFGEHGLFGHQEDCHREQAHVPLLIHGPNLKPATVNFRARLMDVAPTVLDCLGIPQPDSWQGKSLLPSSIQNNRTVWTTDAARRTICYTKKNTTTRYSILRRHANLLRIYNVYKDPYQVKPVQVMWEDELNDTLPALDLIRKKMKQMREYERKPVMIKDSKRLEQLRDTLEELGYMEEP